jgi:hypothetical protein
MVFRISFFPLVEEEGKMAYVDVRFPWQRILGL